MKEASHAINREKRTLLHSACLQFGDGTHEVGLQLVRLLLEKGVNPAAIDVLSKKAVDYVAPRSPISNMLLRPPGEYPGNVPLHKITEICETKKQQQDNSHSFFSQGLIRNVCLVHQAQRVEEEVCSSFFECTAIIVFALCRCLLSEDIFFSILLSDAKIKNKQHWDWLAVVYKGETFLKCIA